MTKRTFTPSEIADIAGVKLRTVQFWTANGALKPEGGTALTGTGNHRRYSEAEARVAFVIGALFRFAASIGTLCAVAEAMRSADVPAAKRLFIAPSEGGGFVVTTDAATALAVMSVDMTDAP